MRWWFRPVLLLVILIQGVVGFFVIQYVANRKSDMYIPSTYGMSILNASTNVRSSLSKLQYFFEPKAITEERDQTSWVKGPIVWMYNEDTLNDPLTYSPEKPADTLRIIALGDSFTFGDHVNTKDSWPEQLESMLTTTGLCPDSIGYEVLNLGVRGYDIQYEVERYKLRGLKYDPDIVLWLLFDNDFDEINELFTPILREQQKSDNKTNSHISVVYSATFQKAKQKFLKTYDEANRMRRIRTFMDDFFTVHTGKTVVAAFPSVPSPFKNMLRDSTNIRENASYTEDIPDIMKDDTLHVLDYHPSVLGHTRIAEAFYTYLKQNREQYCHIRQ